MAMAATSTSSPSSLQFPATSPHSLPSIRLWPPSASTRSTLVQRLADHLSAESFFSQRYGRISPEDSAAHAQRIEEEAFAAASEHAADSESVDIAVVQFYAKDASRLMLECLKKGPSKQADADVAAHDRMTVEIVFDVSDGNREFLTGEAAVSLLEPLTAPGNAYSSICLSNRSFGEDAAMVASKILETLRPQLVKVNLADIVAGRNEEEALTVMSIFSSALSGSNLKYLNLSDNALGEKGVRAFSELLKSQHALEELYFMNNGISEEAAMAICELLPSAKGLKVLHFHNNMTGDGGAVALSKLVGAANCLEDFRCSSTRIATEGGVALAEALLAGSSLKKLDVRDNPYGIEGGIALAKPLGRHLDLKEVYLSYLGIEDEGADAVLDALKQGALTLEILELAGNDLTLKSAEKIANCVASKPNLVKLNLSENDLEDKGVVVICNAISSKNLAELDLSETNIGRIGACAAAKAVALKAQLKLLNLNGNHISDAGIDALKLALEKGNHGITVLGSLDENNEDEAGDDTDEDHEYDQEKGNVSDNLQVQLSKVKM